MSLDRYRNQPCACGSGKKYKHCCQPRHYDDRQQIESPLAKREREKTAQYWAKRYEEVTG